MKIKLKKVYYCDHCKKHSLRPLTKHEARCTGNPDRECYWYGEHNGSHVRAGESHQHIAWAASHSEVTEDLLNELRERVGHCPACMLTVIRLSGFDAYHWHTVGFNYEKEVERFNQERIEEGEWAAMYA